MLCQKSYDWQEHYWSPCPRVIRMSHVSHVSHWSPDLGDLNWERRQIWPQQGGVPYWRAGGAGWYIGSKNRLVLSAQSASELSHVIAHSGGVICHNMSAASQNILGQGKLDRWGDASQGWWMKILSRHKRYVDLRLGRPGQAVSCFLFIKRALTPSVLTISQS